MKFFKNRFPVMAITLLFAVALPAVPVNPAFSQRPVKHRFANLPVASQHKALDTTAPVQEKQYLVVLSKLQWGAVVQQLGNLAAAMRSSTLPSNQVVFYVDSLLIPFQKIVLEQVNAQISKEAKTDSTIKASSGKVQKGKP